MKKKDNKNSELKVDHITISKVQTAYETDRFIKREIMAKCPEGFHLVGMAGEVKEDERKAFSGTIFLTFDKD